MLLQTIIMLPVEISTALSSACSMSMLCVFIYVCNCAHVQSCLYMCMCAGDSRDFVLITISCLSCLSQLAIERYYMVAAVSRQCH